MGGWMDADQSEQGQPVVVVSGAARYVRRRTDG